MEGAEGVGGGGLIPGDSFIRFGDGPSSNSRARASRRSVKTGMNENSTLALRRANAVPRASSSSLSFLMVASTVRKYVALTLLVSPEAMALWIWSSWYPWPVVRADDTQ